MAKTKGEIRLHPTKGVNPRMAACICCGKIMGVVLLGIRDKVITCPCGANNFGFTNRQKCPRCKAPLKGCPSRVIEEQETIKVGACDDCLKEQQRFDAEVASGGVAFRCNLCNTVMVAKAGSPTAVEVRQALGIPAPKFCGIDMSRHQCPKCSSIPASQLPS